jgi:hypothetical protein
MPVDVTLTRLGTNPQALFAVCRRRKGVLLSACALAIGFCAVTLAGCDGTSHSSAMRNTANAYTASGTANASLAARPRLGTPIPLPGRALLSPPAEPDCEFKATDPKTDERMKLDYERQCYRHAEMIVRSRLELLQSSVDKTIKAVKRTERNGS